LNEEENNYGPHHVNDTSGSANNDYENINELRTKLVAEQLSSSGVEAQEIEDPINAVENSGNKIKNRDYIDFVLQCAKKKVKLDDILVKQILYFGLSTYMNDPTNLAVLAQTSTGKTHAVTSILEYFPQEDVRFIGKMSPMALVREQGILVDSNGEPIKARLKQLRHDIDKAQSEKKNLEIIEELEDQLDKVKSEARTQINLNNKILVFLEPPNIELWNGLKPVLSHDRPEIEFPFTNRTEKLGIETKKVVVRGAPVCIFCSAKDESKSEWWEEIENRFFITSPNTNEEKFYLANELTANRKGLPRQLKKRLLVQTSDEILAKKCVEYTKQQILKLSKSHLKPNEVGNDLEDSVWIPYKDELVKFLPSKEGVDMRSAKKIFSLIETVTLANAHLRKKLKLQIGAGGGTDYYDEDEDEEVTPIASLQDLYEVLKLVKDASSIPAHKSDFFWNYFVPCFQAKDGKPDRDEKKELEEKIVGVTSKQLAEYCRHRKGLKNYGSENIRKTFLEYLRRVGYIDNVESVIDKRSDVYYPIIDIEKVQGPYYNKNKSTTNQNDGPVDLNSSSSSSSSSVLLTQQPNTDNHKSLIEHNPNWCLSSKIRKLRNYDSFCNILQESPLIISKNFDNISINWLELQIMAFFNYRIQIRLFSILNEEDNQEISIFRFISEYLNFNPNQIRYYKKDISSKYYNEIFGALKYIGIQEVEISEKLRNDAKFDNFFIFQHDKNGLCNLQPRLPSPKQIPMLPNNDNKVRVET
jgi:hypothetical protein